MMHFFFFLFERNNRIRDIYNEKNYLKFLPIHKGQWHENVTHDTIEHARMPLIYNRCSCADPFQLSRPVFHFP